MYIGVRTTVRRQREQAYTATRAVVHIGAQVFAVVGTSKSDERLKVRELLTAKPSAIRNQRLCLRPHTCGPLGQHRWAVETGQ